MGIIEKFGLMPVQESEASLEKAIVASVMRDLEGKREKVKSYFELIPPQYQEYVKEHLAKHNFGFFKGQFNNDPHQFLEATSRNWLAKFDAFGTLAEQNGFTLNPEVFKKHPSPKELNRMIWAILTKSASYLLVGPGAVGGKGPGAKAIYSRISLRAGAKTPPEQMTMENSFFIKPPVIGEPVSLSAGTSPFTSSEVVKIYTKAGEESYLAAAEEIENLNRSLDGSFIDIDHKTLY